MEARWGRIGGIFFVNRYEKMEIDASSANEALTKHQQLNDREVLPCRGLVEGGAGLGHGIHVGSILKQPGRGQ